MTYHEETHYTFAPNKMTRHFFHAGSGIRQPQLHCHGRDCVKRFACCPKPPDKSQTLGIHIFGHGILAMQDLLDVSMCICQGKRHKNVGLS